jgi:hypothetical protein
MSQAQRTTEVNLGFVRYHALLHLLLFLFVMLAVIQVSSCRNVLQYEPRAQYTLPMIHILLADTHPSQILILYRNKY